ncbi:MAG: phage terminase large subunit family protein [Subdoligranulum sp.]
MNNCMGYIIDCDPGSILFIQPTTVDAKEYSKLRIAPMIRDCPTLRRRVADPKSRDSSNTILQKKLPRRHPDDVRVYRGPRAGIEAYTVCVR